MRVKRALGGFRGSGVLGGFEWFRVQVRDFFLLWLGRLPSDLRLKIPQRLNIWCTQSIFKFILG